MQWLEHKVPPPVVALIVAVMMWAGSRMVPHYALDGSLRMILATALGVFGVGIAGAGVRRFARARTTINPLNIDAASSLVTDGIFTYTRNPMYLGMALILIAWAIFLSSPWLIAGPMVFVSFIGRFQIRPEEAVLLAKFGQQYTSYSLRVRRWI